MMLMDLVAHGAHNLNLYCPGYQKSTLLPSQVLKQKLYYRYIERTPIWIGISPTIIAVGVVSW